MKILIFNGASESNVNTTASRLRDYLKTEIEKGGHEAVIFNIGEARIPFLDMPLAEIPETAVQMCEIFRNADRHIWLAPLYHGSIPGSMKNCLDWLELTSRDAKPYLTGKIIALSCWADGTQAMQGISTMDAVAKALRAWTLPYSLPIIRPQFIDPETGNFTSFYKNKIDLFSAFGNGLNSFGGNH